MERRGVNLAAVRRHNRGRVVDAVLRSGGLDQSSLAGQIGLTQQAISKIVGELVAEGLLEQVRQPSAGVGKPRSQVRLRSEARCAVGVQLGRDRLVAVRCGLDGAVEEQLDDALARSYSPSTAVRRIGAAVDRLLVGQPPSRVIGVGVAAVGPLDHRTRRVRRATGMPRWVDVALGDLLEERLALPVQLDKDTDAGARAHCWPRPIGFATAIVMVDAGIGAGLVFDGELYRGPHSGAGEFGHTTLDHRGPVCTCGRRGCLEELHRRAPTAQARAALLGEAVLDLVRVLDLDSIVLHGRDVRSSPATYVGGARAALDAHVRDTAVTVEVSSLGRNSVALGAALGVLGDFASTGAAVASRARAEPLPT